MSPDEGGDAALDERVRAGDTAALAEFLEQRRNQLLAFIHRSLGDGLKRKVEAEDIFQEVSADCLRSLQEVEFGDRDPFNWLCQVAERRIIDAHRRFFGAQKRAANREVGLGSPGGDTQQAGLIDMLRVSMTSPSAAFSRDQREFKLQAAIENLPEENREALRLRYVEGLPSKEVAQRLGKSDGAVRVMLTRTLKKLQEMLGPDAMPGR